MGESLINFLSDERHERVEKFKGFRENIAKDIFNIFLSLFVRAVEIDFGKFNIPVAETVPDEIIDFLSSNAHVKLFEIICNFFDKAVEVGKNPLIFDKEIFGEFNFINGHVHKEET